MAPKSFPGRIIIDHLPKTGGQALSKWLLKELGTGCVSPDLMGWHQELIGTYGGHHSIVSGHIQFSEGETFDPRYQYITCLRDPVERVLSWLFFVLYDAIPDERAKRPKEAAEIFFKSDGKECPNDSISDYSNFYLNHFSRIGLSGIPVRKGIIISPEDRLAAARAAIFQYDVVGIYEDFPGFIEEVASLVGLKAPTKINRVNASTQRRGPDKISAALRERIVELNQDDIRLYSEVVKWKAEKARDAPISRSTSGWLKVGWRKKRELTVQPASFPQQGIGWLKYDPTVTLLTAPFGSLSVVGPVSPFAINQQKILRVIITNLGFRKWVGAIHFPLTAGYRWLTTSGETYSHEGVRTPLPVEPLPAGASVAVDMAVAAPSEPGIYTLVLTLVQEHFSSLERKGFTPAVIQVVVGDAKVPS